MPTLYSGAQGPYQPGSLQLPPQKPLNKVRGETQQSGCRGSPGQLLVEALLICLMLPPSGLCTHDKPRQFFHCTRAPQDPTEFLVDVINRSSGWAGCAGTSVPRSPPAPWRSVLLAAHKPPNPTGKERLDVCEQNSWKDGICERECATMPWRRQIK